MRSGCRMSVARLGGLSAVTLCLSLLAGGCGSSIHPTAGGAAMRHGAAPATRAAGDSRLGALAAGYLAIARPANHRLDTEVNGFAHEHNSLAAAETDLRAEAATERRFDQLLAKIPFTPQLAVTARALIRANQSRAGMTDQQARSSSLAMLLSFTTRHKAADAAVETQVRIIRRLLHLPPPSTS